MEARNQQRRQTCFACPPFRRYETGFPLHRRSVPDKKSVFDTPEDKALREKIDGVNIREKFRIRFYNSDTSYIVLEKKSKLNGLCAKESCRINAEEAQKIVDGDICWMLSDERPLCTELYSKMKSQRLEPKTIVDYTRDPFVFAPGNVRVTIDYDIRTGLNKTDFLNPETVTLPAGDSPINFCRISSKTRSASQAGASAHSQNMNSAVFTADKQK